MIVVRVELWSARTGAKTELAPGDLVVFAKGPHNQPLSPRNGNDEAYG